MLPEEIALALSQSIRLGVNPPQWVSPDNIAQTRKELEAAFVVTLFIEHCHHHAKEPDRKSPDFYYDVQSWNTRKTVGERQDRIEELATTIRAIFSANALAIKVSVCNGFLALSIIE